ncbi:hypothetical protein FHL15_009887 [Xylaria flabelliformis]|uniref:SET domain-containing protein n=1 Tax=Xylaria flabelliformis TaxID=2512241 RepID=A0A553HMK4_9PEZI|nr:hypothetical protein FHL15_009887 [Xylaria flabelliformis]
MSDISVDADFDEPFEIKSAGDSGLGCFATRDIVPGEVILVDFTTILVPRSDDQKETCAQIASLYHDLHELDQREWMGLAAHMRTDRWELYRMFYRQLGSRFGNETPEFYAMRAMQFDCNSFSVAGTGLSALYIVASRFNHSCDPNVWYENELVPGRWVGRASRNIAQGEELFVSYISNHAPTAQRQTNTTGWDFNCGCNKCLGGNDTYTAFLEDARDVANEAGVDWAMTLSPFVDDIKAMEERLLRRVNLLKQANQPNAAGGTQDNSHQKELIFAKRFRLYKGGSTTGDAYLANDTRRDVHRWQNIWNHRDQAPLGMND